VESVDDEVDGTVSVNVRKMLSMLVSCAAEEETSVSGKSLDSTGELIGKQIGCWPCQCVP
jgi:hypothetical protein